MRSKDSEALREVYQSGLQKLSAYATEMGQNKVLQAGFERVRRAREFDSLDQAQKKIVDNALRDFHLMGVDLAARKKKRFKDIQQRLSTLSNEFERNVLDATNHWHLHVEDIRELSGLPSTALDMARRLAQQNNQEGWRFTLDFPSYLSVMMYADNRALRESMYEAYVTRAGEAGPDAGKFDNTEKIREILKLRREMAALLEYENYAQVSMVTKMAETPQQVLEFLSDLAARARPVALKELQQLENFAASELGINRVQAWDMLYCSEKLKRSLYHFSEEDIRPYFPANHRVAGDVWGGPKAVWGEHPTRRGRRCVGPRCRVLRNK